jgi:hypothetical protein
VLSGISSRRRWRVAVARLWLISFRDKRRLFARKEWWLIVSTMTLILSIVLVPAGFLGWTLRGVTAFGVFLGAWRIQKSRQSYDFPPRQESGILPTLASDLRSKVVLIEGEVFLPLEVPDPVRDDTRVTCTIPYTLPPTLKDLSHPLILGNRDRAWIVDRPGLGLADLGDEVFEVRKLTYFQYLASNYAYRFFARPHGNPEHDALSGFLVKQDGSLVSLGDSKFPNLIGISTLATTREGRLVVVQSSRRNTGSPGLIHPSGSGSAEPRDLREVSSAREFIVTAMERELCEEASIRPDEIVSTSIVGMARWLNKGGMPEFFGLTTTSVRADELATRKPSGEDPLFVKRVLITDLRLQNIQLSLVSRKLDLTVLPNFIAGSCSGPLGMLLWLAQASYSDA